MSYSPQAHKVLTGLQRQSPKKYQKLLQKLQFLQQEPRHPSLRTHKFESLVGPAGEPMFEAYVEATAKAAATLRVFWYYGPEPASITVYTITVHP